MPFEWRWTDSVSLLKKCDSEEEAREQVQNLIEQIRLQAEKIFNPNMKKIINATGTILHTNLGRAPISLKAYETYF